MIFFVCWKREMEKNGREREERDPEIEWKR